MANKAQDSSGKALVGIIMGSTSDWETMSHAAHTLDAHAHAITRRSERDEECAPVRVCQSRTARHQP